MSDQVAWCEIENRDYTADLSLWLGLCSRKPLRDSPAPTHGARSVLELGAGVGRVSLRLRTLGVAVSALDRERELLDELVRRAEASEVGEISAICADARSYRTGGRRFDLILAPQAFVQLFEARSDRVAIMACAADHLAHSHSSSFWMSFQPDLEQAFGEEEDAPLPPRVMELGGRSYEIESLDSYWKNHDGARSLRIVWARRIDGSETIARTSYAELTQAGLEAEAGEAGLELADSITLQGNGHFLDQVALRFAAAGR
jgi:hypothetical protein